MTAPGGVPATPGADEIKEVMRTQRWNGRHARAYHSYRLLSSRRRWAGLLARELADVPPGAEVLEVGSGTGFITEILAGAGFRVRGMDLSPDMLAIARANLEAAHLGGRVRLAEGDAEALDAPDGGVAAVVSRWVLWTLPQPKRALAEMVRVLAPGGRVVVIDGRALPTTRWDDWRAALVDMAVAGRLPGWRRPCYARIDAGLPRLNAAQVADELRALGLADVSHRDLPPEETDGPLKHWLTGSGWQSHLATGVKPR
ncbi:MAG: methyltransferase domain-containing protein [Pseudodesulfovibrio sp.]